MVETFPPFTPSLSLVPGHISASISPTSIATGLGLTTTSAAGLTFVPTIDGGVIVVQTSNRTLAQITQAASTTGTATIPTFFTSSHALSSLLTSTLLTSTPTPTPYPALDTGAGVGVGVAIAATLLSLWGIGVYIWRRTCDRKHARRKHANDQETPPQGSNPPAQPELEDNGKYLYELSGRSRKAEMATDVGRHELPVIERTQEFYVEYRGYDPQGSNNV